MSEVGALIIKLQAETAQFREDMGKVKQDLDDLGRKADEAGEGIAGGMGEARGCLDVGRRVCRRAPAAPSQFPHRTNPRTEHSVRRDAAHRRRVVAIEIVGKLIEKHEELAKAQQKAALEGNDLAISQDDETRSLQLTNLKLDDQIAKLEHQPAHNYLKEAMLESAEAADKLAEHFASSLLKMNSELMETTTLWSRFKDIASGSGGTVAGLAGSVASNQMQVESVKKVEQALLGVEAARRKLADSPAGSDEWHKNFSALAAAVKELETDATRATPVMVELTDQLRMASVASTAAAEYKDMGLQAEAAGKKIVIAGLEEHPIRIMVMNDIAAQQRAKKKAAEEAVKLAEEALAADDAFHKAMHAQWEKSEKEQEQLAEQSLNFQLTMARLAQQASMEAAHHTLAMRKDNAKQEAAIEMKAVHDTAAIELNALNQRIAALDKGDADYLKKLTEFENKKKEIIAKASLETTKIRDKAEEEQLKDVMKAEEKMASAISTNIAKSLVEQKDMAKAFEQMGKQMAEAALANALKMIMIGNMKQAKDAGHAAASAFTWVMQDVPFPANAFLAPAAAAAAFAGVMAFHTGGEVGGVGEVPILAEAGETVVSKVLTDHVKNSTVNNSSESATHYHLAIDARGADAGVEARLHGAIKKMGEQAIARSVAAVQDRAARK